MQNPETLELLNAVQISYLVVVDVQLFNKLIFRRKWIEYENGSII